jgi:hypothetical protein
MRAQFIGRVLGSGLRVGGRIVGEKLMGSTESASAPQPTANAAVQGRMAGQTVRQGSGSVARGVGGFLRPFRRVGGILWLEVTGVFFLLPVIAFGPNLWRMRASWAHGPDHRLFVVTSVVVVVFLYLGVSSFWRARHR